ncbi:hypothetical protein FACS1894172_04080 [Spirochaetia bacterium]|nr:hypothetical protein FACS1894164_07260 [Spirochaetia bacterium]GHU30577.1 hypothetical protein FACS1894172_04080 [Spirochaetia bacterium]
MLISGWICAEEPEIPVINEWRVRDPVYRQYRKATDIIGQRLFLDRPEQIVESLEFFVYTTERGIDFFTVAAPTSLWTLATLNRLSHPFDRRANRTVLLPTVPGIFIPENPESGLEHLIASRRPEGGIPVTVDGKKFRFFPGKSAAAKFADDEWTLFVSIFNEESSAETLVVE